MRKILEAVVSKPGIDFFVKIEEEFTINKIEQ